MYIIKKKFFCILVGNRCLDPTNPHYRKHCHQNNWTDITLFDIKLFIAHNIIMGIINMLDLEKYWNTNKNTKIPFFGKYMSRNKFQSILWNLHVVDDSNNPPFGSPGHNPLAKLHS